MVVVRFLERNTWLTLLQPTQLFNGYLLFAGEGSWAQLLAAGPARIPTNLVCRPGPLILCFDRTTYDNINGPGGPFMLDIIDPAGPLMYPDQISCYRPCVMIILEPHNHNNKITSGLIYTDIHAVSIVKG